MFRKNRHNVQDNTEPNILSLPKYKLSISTEHGKSNHGNIVFLDVKNHQTKNMLTNLKPI